MVGSAKVTILQQYSHHCMHEDRLFDISNTYCIIPDPDGLFDFIVDSPQNTKDKIFYIIHGIMMRNVIYEQSLRQYIQSLFLQTYNSIVSIKCIYLINGILWNGGISH